MRLDLFYPCAVSFFVVARPTSSPPLFICIAGISCWNLPGVIWNMRMCHCLTSGKLFILRSCKQPDWLFVDALDWVTQIARSCVFYIGPFRFN